MAVFKQAQPVDVMLDPDIQQRLTKAAGLLGLGLPSFLALLLAERQGPEVLQDVLEKRVNTAISDARHFAGPSGDKVMFYLAYPSEPNWQEQGGNVEVNVDLKSIRDGTVVELFHFTLRFILSARVH